MSSLPPDYDDDPGRWGSWKPPEDVHEVLAGELQGPVLDVGCGEGRLATVLPGGVTWIGVDSSAAQLAGARRGSVARADMRALPFRADSFAEVVHLWCLYHLDDPVQAIAEAARVLRPGGRYVASTSARSSDPELMPEGHPATTFDAEEAPAVVGRVFADVEEERWDQPFFPLETRDEVRAFCRHNFVPVERAEIVEVPLWLTKRGVLVRATKR